MKYSGSFAPRLMVSASGTVAGTAANRKRPALSVKVAAIGFRHNVFTYSSKVWPLMGFPFSSRTVPL